MRKGFTLVEMLAVIALLGIITLVIVPTVDKSIVDTKEKAYNKQVEAIKLALKEYQIDNKELFYDTNIINLKLIDLKEQSYLEYDLKNPLIDECISNDLPLLIEKVGKKYNYIINADELIPGDSSDCMIPEENIEE